MNSLVSTGSLPPRERLNAYRRALQGFCASFNIDSTAEVMTDEP
ncbi:hypothetical protein [Phenylobacterium montanum]|nr:hypothetical protein [Caulobacter sp. S6]